MHTVQPFQSYVAGRSHVADQEARSAAVSVPVWCVPLVSRVGRADCRTSASATNPVRHTSRAASISASRPPAPATSASSRFQVAARAGLRKSRPGRGGSPSGRYTAAEEVHSVSNSSRTVSTVPPTRSTGACPCSAYPMAYVRTSASGLVPWSRRSSIQASKAPGTAAASGPVPGTRSRPRER